MSRERVRKVHLIGYYGWGNFGDDLFVDIARTKRSLLWPGSRVQTFVPDRIGGHSRPGTIGSANRGARALTGAIWADTFALFGGSILSEHRGVMKRREQYFASRSFEGLGVSIGPFKTRRDEERLLPFLSTFDRLIVRDHKSAERFGEQVAVGGDLAALSSRIHRSEPDGSVTIAPSAAAKVSPSRLVSQVRDVFQRNRGVRPSAVNLLALNIHPQSGDEALCKHLAEGLSDLGILIRRHSYRDLGLQGVIDVISASSAVWAQRLHAGIVAYLCGVSFLLVGHHAKCWDFAQDVGLDSSQIVGSHDSWTPAAIASIETHRSSPPWRTDPADYAANARRVYGIVE